MATGSLPPELLDPASSWADKEGFAATSRELAALFHKNFAEKKYADAVEPAVVAAGPVGAHAYPIGTMIVEGKHQRFHALACPLKPVIIQRRRR